MAVTDVAIERIKGQIVTGQLRPGQRIPPEAELAAELGISRNSLREAVKALSLVNILDVRRGDGTYVTSLAPDLLLDAVSFLVDFHRDDSVLHFLEVRRELESAAAARAATRISADQLDQLVEINQRLIECPSIDDLVETDLAFHHLIAVASGNPIMAGLIDTISAPTIQARIWRGVTQGGARQRAVGEHMAIIEAIRFGDPDLARARASSHVAAVEAWLGQIR